MRSARSAGSSGGGSSKGSSSGGSSSSSNSGSGSGNSRGGDRYGQNESSSAASGRGSRPGGAAEDPSSISASNVDAVSLKVILRRRLLNEMIRAVQPASKWKVLVVDPITMRILNAALKTYEIFNENVTLVELLTRRRQPYPNVEAIYFISPTPEAIAYLEADFPPPPPGQSSSPNKQYRAAHLYFSSVLSDSLMQRIKKSSAARYILGLKELFVDFRPIERRVFTFQMPASFFKLYSPDSGGIHVQSAELACLSTKLSNVIASLGDGPPTIRYYRPQSNNADISFPKAAKLASLLSNEISSLVSSGAWASSSEAPKSLVLIVDRGIDVVAPILHEFTYQAMACDLLELEDEGTKYTYETGPDGPKEAILDDENDQLWAQFRHTHIADTTRLLTDGFNKFLSENKAAAASASNPGGANGEASPSTAAQMRKMKEAIFALPQYQELKQKYTVHINMAQECMKLFERRKIAQTGSLEQDMATGETSDGMKPKTLVPDMVPLLDDPTVPEFDKVRLLMLYIIHKQGVQDEDRSRLLGVARIDPVLSESITNLALVGVVLSKLASQDNKKKEDKKKKQNKTEAESSFELGRFRPQLRQVIEDLAKDILDKEVYPYANESSRSNTALAAGSLSNGAGSGSSGGGMSLRSTKPTWQGRTGAPKVADKKPKIIIFVIGGMTFSEARCAYEVADLLGREIYIGSSHMITPRKFISDLRDLRNPDAFAEKETVFGNGPGPAAPAASSSGSSKSTPKRRKSESSSTPAASSSSEDTKKKKKGGFFGLF